jgi:hypothetical protein
MGGPRNIDSLEELDVVLKHTKLAFISAGRNPAVAEDVALSDADISQRDKDLKEDLKDLGYQWTPALGKYGSLPEGSIIVLTHDPTHSDMMKLGEKYHQDAVLFTDEGHSQMISTTGDNKGERDAQGDGYEMVPAADDYYTEVDIQGKKTRFSMILEWGKSLLHFFVKVWK